VSLVAVVGVFVVLASVVVPPVDFGVVDVVELLEDELLLVDVEEDEVLWLLLVSEDWLVGATVAVDMTLHPV